MYEDIQDADARRYEDAWEQQDAADDGRDPWDYTPRRRGEFCGECGEWFERGNFAARRCCVCEEE